MPTPPYIKGRLFEWRVKRYMEAKGCLVVRSAGSRHPDLVAVCPDGCYLIECKVDKSKFTRMEKERLVTLARRHGAKAMIAYRERNRLVTEILHQ